MKILNSLASLDNIEDGNTRRLLTLDSLFPVGSVYITESASLSPGTFLTGSWKQIGTQGIGNTPVYYWLRRPNVTSLIDLTSANTSLWDERADSHTINDTDSITVSFSTSWARTACMIYNLSPNTAYVLSGHIINNDGFLCGFYYNGSLYSMGSDTLMTKSITLMTDEYGQLYVEFYGNMGEDDTPSSVTFSDLTLYLAPIYPSQNRSSRSNGFTITFEGTDLTIDGRNDSESYWGWTEKFNMNLEPNKTYSLLLTNTGGTLDASARIAQSDGIVTDFHISGYDSQDNQTTLERRERDRVGIYHKYFFTPTTTYDKYMLSVQAKKYMIFNNWVCNIKIEKEDEVYPINPTIELGSIDSSGQESSSSSYTRTGFIPTKDVYKLSLSNSEAVTMRITCYDENKNHISTWNEGYGYRNITGGSGTIADLDSNCRYIRIRLSSNNTSNVVTIIYNN